MAGMEPLSEKTVGEIDALARKISVAHRLDAEIQAELRGHVEDKVRGYVSGEIGVSEADALLLAKAHFGGAGVIKGMFQGVHGTTHAGALGRRVAAAFVATLGVSAAMTVVDVLWTAIVVYPVATMAGERNSLFLQAFHFLFTLVSTALWMILLWALFAFWRKRQNQGRRMWFETWNPLTIVAIVIGVLAVQMAIDNLLASAINSTHSSQTVALYFNVTGDFARTMNWIISCSAAAAEAVLWMWWADRAPRTRRGLIYTLIYWVIASEFIMFAPWFVNMGLQSLARGEMNGRTITDFFFIMRSAIPQSLGFDALGGLVGLVAYVGVTRSRRGLCAG